MHVDMLVCVYTHICVQVCGSGHPCLPSSVTVLLASETLSLTGLELFCLATLVGQ